MEDTENQEDWEYAAEDEDEFMNQALKEIQEKKRLESLLQEVTISF